MQKFPGSVFTSALTTSCQLSPPLLLHDSGWWSRCTATLLFTVVKARPVKTSRCLVKIKSNKEVRYKHVSCDSENFNMQKMLQKKHINRHSANLKWSGTPSNKKMICRQWWYFSPLKIKDFPSFMLVYDIRSRNLDQYSFLWSKLRESRPIDASKKVSFPHGGIELKKSHWKLSQSSVYKPMLWGHSSSNIDIWYIQTLISS